jgi:hypothetical protein
MNFLKSRGVHFFANNSLNIAVHQVAQRQPSENSRCHSPHVATAHQKPVAWHLGVSRILA